MQQLSLVLLLCLLTIKQPLQQGLFGPLISWPVGSISVISWPAPTGFNHIGPKGIAGNNIGATNISNNNGANIISNINATIIVANNINNNYSTTPLFY